MTQGGPPTILHLGTMFWPPNVRGVLWFAREVLPLVRSQVADARFVIVGKKPPAEVSALAADPRIEVTGYVADPEPYLAAADAFIVPLHAGGGMRVKILDAWLWGLPVVSTLTGAEGIETCPGDDILVTPDHDAEAFARAVVQVLTDPVLNAKLRRNGRAAVEARYSWQTVYARVDAVYASAARILPKNAETRLNAVQPFGAPEKRDDCSFMSETPRFCPFLGLAADRTVARNKADTGHRCYAVSPAGSPELAYQKKFCQGSEYGQCPLYDPEEARTLEAGTVQPAERRPRRWPALLAWAALALMVAAVVFVYLRDAGMSLNPAANPPAAATATATATEAAAAANTAPPPALPAVPDTSLLSATPVPRYGTPTPGPGGRTISLSSKAGDAGWWTGAEARGNHLGDSFLYAGYTRGQAFVSAARFDLSAVPRGAAIRAAELRLMGLNDERFDADAGGTWSIEMLQASSLPDYAKSDFQTLLNAPARGHPLPHLLRRWICTWGRRTWSGSTSRGERGWRSR